MKSRIKNSSPSPKISLLASTFDRALRAGNTESANAIAMAAADELFEHDAEFARSVLWENFFSKLTEHSEVQYQAYDFEIADYQLYRALPSVRLCRGPRPDMSKLASGRFVTLFGAAQLFGRFRQKSPHIFVEEKLDLAGVNLAMGGAGPESFMHKKHLQLVNCGKALILQILSGRSIGCDEYPGFRITRKKKGKGRRIDRLKLLTQIWQESPQEAIRLVGKWQQNYLLAFERLIAEVKVPVILVWISDRTVDDWSIECMADNPDFGRFPQLVDRKMFDAMAERSTAVVEISSDTGLPHELISRFTGKKCPAFRPKGQMFWENSYYPSGTASIEIGQKIAEALDAMNIGRL